MKIQLNGETRTMPDGLSAEELINLLELRGRRIAMELNGEIVPRSEHAARMLADGDRVEIVHAVGGG